MAAFGVPRTHEDDAARAVRQAFAILTACTSSGLRRGSASRPARSSSTRPTRPSATGEAVNVAARLQQIAGAGEIVLGPTVRRLAAGTVEVEDLGPLEIRGLPRRTDLAGGAAGRRSKRVAVARLIGREEVELENAARPRGPRPAGDARHRLRRARNRQDRLVGEFVEGVERVTSLTGRSLPYGEGVTYAAWRR
jgi:hypothetical protein